MQIKSLVIMTVLSSFTSIAIAEESKEDKIARAMSAAPPTVSDQATILDNDGTLLKQGSNGWTCMPDTMPGDRAPLCNDAVWMEMMQALMSQKEYTADRIGISYMLQGEPMGSGVSNSNPYHHDHGNAEDYVETGPHVMIIVPKALLKGITSDPTVGGPYVMWGDTPYAHIMLPVSVDGKQTVTKPGK